MRALTGPERLIEAGVLFLVVFTPLAFGTVEPWSEAIAELVVLGMALTWVTGNLRNWEFRLELPPAWLPALLFLALIALQFLVPSWSLDGHTTKREALKLLAAGTFFLICYNTYRTRSQARRLLWTIIAVGTVIAVFGVVQRVTWTGRLYWFGPEAPRDAGYTFGPFVNRAHFAGLAAIVIPAALALFLASVPRPRRAPGNWRDRLRDWNSREESGTSFIPFLVVVVGATALISGSRGGVGAVLAAVVTVLVLAPSRRGPPTVQVGRLALVGVLIVLAAVAIGGDMLSGTIERLVDEFEQPEGSYRLAVWGDALGLWAKAPIVGIGLASFGVAFPGVRSLEGPFTVSHSESDLIQLLVETGIVGAVLALVVIGTLARALFGSCRIRAGQSASAFALAGLAALVGSVVQGVVNYSLPVMSNLVYLAAVIAVGCPGRLRADA